MCIRDSSSRDPSVSSERSRFTGLLPKRQSGSQLLLAGETSSKFASKPTDGFPSPPSSTNIPLIIPTSPSHRSLRPSIVQPKGKEPLATGRDRKMDYFFGQRESRTSSTSRVNGLKTEWKLGSPKESEVFPTNRTSPTNFMWLQDPKSRQSFVSYESHNSLGLLSPKSPNNNHEGVAFFNEHKKDPIKGTPKAKRNAMEHHKNGNYYFGRKDTEIESGTMLTDFSATNYTYNHPTQTDRGGTSGLMSLGAVRRRRELSLKGQKSLSPSRDGDIVAIYTHRMDTGRQFFAGAGGRKKLSKVLGDVSASAKGVRPQNLKAYFQYIFGMVLK
eukprot:TRINITY_DN11448_c0_g1_i1.p1 TRINITY_DN11448_c0_g1~~TRINITY_DN11448_c0_g1_i1.p1  ORF type:complete len:348 (-),score=45.74 TRINITY_DN11448_c0_g1_i1:155-1141(-)